MAVLLGLVGWPSKPWTRSAPVSSAAIHVMTAFFTLMLVARVLMHFFLCGLLDWGCLGQCRVQAIPPFPIHKSVFPVQKSEPSPVYNVVGVVKNFFIRLETNL
jgi:hypothetical protein